MNPRTNNRHACLPWAWAHTSQDAHDAVYPAMASHATFVTTRTSVVHQALPPNCKNQPRSTCGYQNLSSSVFYINKAPLFTVR